MKGKERYFKQIKESIIKNFPQKELIKILSQK